MAQRSEPFDAAREALAELASELREAASLRQRRVLRAPAVPWLQLPPSPEARTSQTS